MSIGLVLEGGAMRGMYTAGVLDVFLDNQIKVDGIIGVSAGVLFGVNYVSGQKGRTIRYNKKYAKDSRYMGMKSFLLTGNIINKDFAYYEIPSKLDIFDEQAFEKADIDFWATITNVETGKPEYVKLFREGKSTVTKRKELLQKQREKLLKKQKNINETIDRLNYKIKLYDDIEAGKRKDFMEKP